LAYIKLTGKAKLTNDVNQQEVRVKQAQSELNRTVNGKPLAPNSPEYIAADKKFKDAVRILNEAKTALANYVEPEKPKTAKQIEAERQQAIIDGTVLPAGGTASGEPNTNQNNQAQAENFDALAKTAREFVKNTLDNAGRLELANKLKAAGIDVPITGEYTDALTNAYKNAIGGAKSSWNAFKEYPTVEAYLNEQARQVAALKAAGVGGEELPKPFGTQEIFNKSTAEGVIENLYKTFTGKDANASEVDSLYKELLAEQKKLSSISKGTYKMVNGRRVLVQETGLDPKVFLENRIKQLPAYKESLAAKSEQNKVSLASTALANGYDLDRDFGDQLPGWLDAINNGEKISKFQTAIRTAARRSLPEAVRNQIDPSEDLSTTFATYASNYARTYGIPVSQVPLNKVIGFAVTDKGFATTTEFDKKKKSEASWWDSLEAKTEIPSLISTVLKDFGFKG
jgi:hypothetical protein